MLSFLVEVRPKDDCAGWIAWEILDGLNIHEVLNLCGVNVAHGYEYRAKRLSAVQRMTALQRLHHERGFRP